MKIYYLNCAEVAGSATTEHIRNGVIDLIAGSLGGSAQVFVGQPFDTVKVKMQTFPALYKGMVDCFRKTYEQDGIVKGLYAGTLPSVVANVAENSVLFAGYGLCQKLIMSITHREKVGDLSIIENAIAGSLASLGSSFTLCPTELIKCKLQAMGAMEQLKKKKVKLKPIGAAALTRHIIRTEGVRGLFNGLPTTIIREMPGYFFFFGGYEGTREYFRAPNQSRDDIGLVKTMVAGSVGGVVLWLAIFPVDVVKSRLQVTNVKASATELTMKILHNEGIFALYNGLMPTIFRTIPATATLFVVYEYSKKYMTFLFE